MNEMIQELPITNAVYLMLSTSFGSSSKGTELKSLEFALSIYDSVDMYGFTVDPGCKDELLPADRQEGDDMTEFPRRTVMIKGIYRSCGLCGACSWPGCVSGSYLSFGCVVCICRWLRLNRQQELGLHRSTGCC